MDFCLPEVVGTALASVICLTNKKRLKLYSALLLNKLLDYYAKYAGGAA